LYLRHADKFENESSRQIRGALDSFEAVTLNSHTHPTYDSGHGLSDFGQVQSWILNKVLIEELKLPIGKVISSPIKRCRETANIISGQIPETSDLLIYDAILKPIEIDIIKVKQLDLFYNSFSDKNNTVIVAHGFPVLERIGIKANIGQADTLVLKKNSTGTIEVAEWLTISDWVNLLARKIKYE
jgi:phosphohistidine phosphatase SixA